MIQEQDKEKTKEILFLLHQDGFIETANQYSGQVFLDLVKRFDSFKEQGPTITFDSYDEEKQHCLANLWILPPSFSGNSGEKTFNGIRNLRLSRVWASIEEISEFLKSNPQLKPLAKIGGIHEEVPFESNIYG